MTDLFNLKPVAQSIKPWKPSPLDHVQWPPDYPAVYAWRLKQAEVLGRDSALLESARAYYKTRPAEFIMHWMDTYNPRKTDNKWMPFIFFKRQYEFVQFLHQLRQESTSGLVEKCRDAGATWIACGYSVWSWLFIQNDAIGWGSRKQDLVDKLGEADSIFEKMRLIISRLPKFWLPKNFSPRNHATFMKLINPENGSTIAGEAGDNIGRGGRKSMYFKDESSHYERPEKIEAALGDNTNVQVDISSVNGLGNVFHRRREAGVEWQAGQTMERGKTQVFIIDWRHHPEKTEEWYHERRLKFESEGMQHVFAQEVDRNYSAAVLNTIINGEWIQAAIDAHLKIPALRVPPPDVWGAGLDVADEGMDRNALTMRQWVIVRHCEEWGERDAGVTTRRAIRACRSHPGIKVQYDSIGVGATVKAEYNRLIDTGDLAPDEMPFVPWNAGAGVVWPYERIVPGDDQSALNRDFFYNMKAQAWWALRTRFYKTWRAITDETPYDAEELISLDSSMPLLHQLVKELAQPTKGDSSGLRMIVNKTPEGTKSPNLADSLVMCMFPVPDQGGVAAVGGYSGG